MRTLKLYATYTQEVFYKMPMYTYDDFLGMLNYERKNMKKLRVFVANCRRFRVEPLKIPFSAEQITCEFRKPLPRANRYFLRQTQELADERTLRTQAVQGETIPDLRLFKPKPDVLKEQSMNESLWSPGFMDSSFRRASFTG